MTDLGIDIGPDGDLYPPGYVAKLVHELRTPLTALRGSLGLLASVVDDASPDVKNFASIAERNASKLAAMLDDLAALERIRAGSVVAVIEPIDLADLIETVVAAGQPAADKSGVTVQTSLDTGEVESDPAILKRVVLHVLLYAIRMSASGSAIQVRARRDGESAHIEITDSGKPVEATGDELFDPFSLVARRGQDGSARPGLGLAIARAEARLLGAALTFTSGEDGGRFVLTLPGFGTRDSGSGSTCAGREAS